MDALKFLNDMRTKEIRDANGNVIHLEMRDLHADVYELIVWTGGRSNEIANLRPADIDFHAGSITFNAKVGIRLVPMDEPLAEVLNRLIKRLIKAADDTGREFLIPGGMLGIGQILRRWSQRLGVKVSARALRHSIAHGFVGSGLALDRTRDQLGHTNISTTDAYINPREKRKKQVLGAL
ncbi:MAG: site-specific integrase [bacterium]|nr:site-specific integrase [bacterium]